MVNKDSKLMNKYKVVATTTSQNTLNSSTIYVGGIFDLFMALLEAACHTNSLLASP